MSCDNRIGPIAARMKEIELPSRKIPLLPVIKRIDMNVPLAKNLARLHEGLQTHRERVVDIGILDE